MQLVAYVNIEADYNELVSLAIAGSLGAEQHASQRPWAALVGPNVTLTAIAGAPLPRARQIPVYPCR